jgi:lipopolysaccharide export system permease protein
MLSNVFLFHHPKRGEYWFMMADEGVYGDGLLTLQRPVVYQFEGTRLIQFEVRDRHIISQRIAIDAFFGTPLPDEQTARELSRTVAELKSRGIFDQAREYELELQSRYAIPFSCVVFALFGPVFAIRFARGGAFVGVLVSVIVVVIYYNLWVLLAQVLARNHALLPVVVGAWAPNVVFLLAALVAIWRSE